MVQAVSRCPARYDEELGMWVVDDPGEVRGVLLDPGTFRPDNAVVAHTGLSVKALRVLQGVGFALPPTLANNPGESHRAIRAAVARFFSPAKVAAVEPLARELVAERVRAAFELLESGPVDLVEVVASEPPAVVLLEMLGVCDVDVPTLKAWSRESLELFWGWPDEDRQLELAHSAAEFYVWLRKRVRPGEDFFGVLVSLGLSEEEVCAVAYFLLIAGQETTTQLISTAFHRSVGQIVDDPKELVELVLRESSSVPTWRRITAHPAVVGEVELPAGAPILLGLSGHGGPADLAFGLGIHRCLGAGLARLETRIALECAAPLLSAVRAVETDPPMVDLLSFRAPARVLVTRWRSPGNTRPTR